MATRAVRLVYPPSLLNRPIINQLIRRFELTVNILRAQISLEEGWLEVEFTGETSEIDRAMGWLTSEGIEVKDIA